MFVGRVSELRRYPVKSMLGESLMSADVAPRGFVGDRVCALLDEQTGRIASAKLPQRWKELLGCAARYSEDTDAIEVSLPNGLRWNAAAPEAGSALSELLGRTVKFVFARPDGLEIERADPIEVEAKGSDNVVGSVTMHIGMGAPEGGFFDAFPIHLITTSSLGRVAEEFGLQTIEAVRFRPNIVIECDDARPFVENEWAGAVLAIGESLRLRVIMPTPRCAVPTLSHGELPEARGLSRLIGELNKPEVLTLGTLPCLGAYARIERPGRVMLGQDVSRSS